MKQLWYISLLLVLMSTSASAQIGMAINTTGANPDTSAMLDVSASTKGILIPRLTTAQRDAIALPATGLLIYNLSTGTFDYYTGVTWISLSTASTAPLVPTIRTYTTNSTWTKPANLIYITVEGVGGGGAGGGCYQYGGGAGAAGGYFKKIISATSLTATVSITIGMGGIGGSPQSPGGDGGTSSFGSYCSATGGQGGRGENATTLSSFGANSGIGINGDINTSGQGGGGITGSGQPPYQGGSSYYGGGAPPNPSNYTASNGNNANSYGSGASGGTCYGVTTHSGGNGSVGIIIITEYY